MLFAWKSTTAKVDLWSLGCIMAEFLCGRIIFAGRDRTFKVCAEVELFSLLFIPDLQQLKLILELLGTPSNEFFIPSCHLCITTQNLRTGEKYIRSLPHYRKKNFRRFFEECDDETAIVFMEKLLLLDPAERINSDDALRHEYLSKHNKDRENIIPNKFDETFEVGEDWEKCIEENVDIKT